MAGRFVKVLIVVWLITILLFYAVERLFAQVTEEAKPAAGLLELTVAMHANRSVLTSTGRSLVDTIKALPDSAWADSTIGYWSFKNMGMSVRVAPNDSAQLKIRAMGGIGNKYAQFDSLVIAAAGTYLWDIATPPDYAERVYFKFEPTALGGDTLRVSGVLMRRRY